MRQIGRKKVRKWRENYRKWQENETDWREKSEKMVGKL
jgi:hypothetical protein